jgi:DNA-directed RNA polymerase subunit RPC12/RpoP
MGEQNVNTGPRYSGPIGILRPRDVLVFSCSACGREAKIAMREFASRVGPSLWLEEIDPRLRCTHCGVRGKAQLMRIDFADE